ncbi:MAG: protein jag [Terriglobia bacterium]
MSGNRWIRDGQLDHEALIPALRSFIGSLVHAAGFELRAEVEPLPAGAEEVENVEMVVNFQGRDAEQLLARHGELLRALEHITLRWLRLEPRYHDHIRFDCQDYRAGRIAELKLAAETAAARVKQSRIPFRFNPMDARERRILHLALRDDPGVRTASEGEGELRSVVIYPA